MSKKASITTKSKKTPVNVCRLFLKLSMMFAIFSVFLFISGKSIVDNGTVLILAVICAAAYAICYYFYKLPTKPQNGIIRFQIRMLVRFLSFVIGIFAIISGSYLLAENLFYGLGVFAVGLLLCQLLHNNKSVQSHISTFCANASTGLIVVTLKMMYDDIKNPIYLAIFGASIVLVVFSEVFYRAYSNKKHGKQKDKKSDKRGKKEAVVASNAKSGIDWEKSKLLREMLKEEIAKSVLIAAIVLLLWALLVITKSIAVILEANTYEKVTKLLPIGISVITVSVTIWNNFIKQPKEEHISFDLKSDLKQFRNKLVITFGSKSNSVKAFDYVTKHMTSKNGYSRWNGDNYYVHPVAVADILLEYNENKPKDDEIAAALLHDCAEDLINSGEKGKEYSLEDYKRYISDYVNDEEGKTFVSEYPEMLFDRQREYLDYLAVAFNKNVSKIVELVTKGYESNGRPKDYSKEEVMRGYLNDISKNVSAAKIKIADRMNNNSTLTVCTKEKKERKTQETRKFYLPFARKVSDNDMKNIGFYEKAAKFFEQEIV